MIQELNRHDTSAPAPSGSASVCQASLRGGDPNLGGGYHAPLRRTLDAVRLNEVANHPDVRPHVGAGDGPLDLSGIIADPRNHALELDGGGFVMQQLEPGIYEVHSLFLKEARRYTVSAMRDGMKYMFCHTDCFRLVTRVPADNAPAMALAMKGGFVTWFSRGADDYMALDLDGWVANAFWTETLGGEFHDLLEAAKNASGSSLPVHDDDAVHDRFVGAAIEMVRCGNAAKGVGVYNRWAKFAGYAPISLISMSPVVVDIVDAIIGVDGQDLQVLLCR